MLQSDEIVPFYATLGRIIDKPHTLTTEVEALRERFPYGGVQSHLDILVDRLGHFLFREEDAENVVALHRRAIELVGETLALGPGMDETEVAVAIRTVMAEGSDKFQGMDSPDYPVVPLGDGVFARKPGPRESTSQGLLFYLEFLRLREKAGLSSPERMPSGDISFDVETVPGEVRISREGEPPMKILAGPATIAEKKRIIQEYIKRSNQRTSQLFSGFPDSPITGRVFFEPPTDSRNYPPAIMRDPDFQEALKKYRGAEQSEEDKDDETDE